MMHWLVRLPITVPAADSMLRLQLSVPVLVVVAQGAIQVVRADGP